MMKLGIYHKFAHHTRVMYVVIVLALSCVLISCAPHLGDTDAALALEDIAAQRGASRLKQRTDTPVRNYIQYSIDGRTYAGDIYMSQDRIRAGIVLVPGIVPEGKDDIRLVALANTLARMQFAVLVPDLQGLRHYRIRKSDVREVADAFRYLASQSAWAPQGQAGIAGFSYGAGPVLLAALEPDVREHVRFIITLGGYYDLRSIVTYFTTGYYSDQHGGHWLFKKPNPYIKWVFALSNIELLDRAEDRKKLRALAADPDARIDISSRGISDLGPDAQALYELLINKDPSRVTALLDGLSPRIRNELEGINPASQDLSRLEAQVILIHGRSDTMIPYTESIALARALSPEQARLFLIEGFAHVDIQLKHQDIPFLLDAMAALLKQRVQ